MGVGLAGCSRPTENQPPQQQQQSPPAQQEAAAQPPPPTETSVAAEAPTPPPAPPPAPAPAAETTVAPSNPVAEQLVAPSQPATEEQGDTGAYETFYSALADQGEWIETPDYGYVFQPAVRDPQWAPYSNGHWVYTDAGWTWVSNEPWGWATYHYGRWANIEGTGWVWVPGKRWAPAWVSWRHGGGYCGWAPLPPESAHVDVRIGNDCDVTFKIGAGCYNFIPQKFMGEPDYRPHYVNHGNNVTIVQQTKNITNITINKTVINNYQVNAGTINNVSTVNNFHQVTVRGPSLQEISAASRAPIQHVTLAPSNQRGPAVVHGSTLAVFAPNLPRNAGHPAQPPVAAQRINQVTVNRGDNAAKPLQATRTLSAPAPNPPAAQREPPPTAVPHPTSTPALPHPTIEPHPTTTLAVPHPTSTPPPTAVPHPTSTPALPHPTTEPHPTTTLAVPHPTAQPHPVNTPALPHPIQNSTPIPQEKAAAPAGLEQAAPPAEQKPKPAAPIEPTKPPEPKVENANHAASPAIKTPEPEKPVTPTREPAKANPPAQPKSSGAPPKNVVVKPPGEPNKEQAEKKPTPKTPATNAPPAEPSRP